eukprot:ANDGO_05072.mRNA.1 hypothetical protein
MQLTRKLGLFSSNNIKTILLNLQTEGMVYQNFVQRQDEHGIRRTDVSWMIDWAVFCDSVAWRVCTMHQELEQEEAVLMESDILKFQCLKCGSIYTPDELAAAATTNCLSCGSISLKECERPDHMTGFLAKKTGLLHALRPVDTLLKRLSKYHVAYKERFEVDKIILDDEYEYRRRQQGAGGYDVFAYASIDSGNSAATGGTGASAKGSEAPSSSAAVWLKRDRRAYLSGFAHLMPGLAATLQKEEVPGTKKTASAESGAESAPAPVSSIVVPAPNAVAAASTDAVYSEDDEFIDEDLKQDGAEDVFDDEDWE